MIIYHYTNIRLHNSDYYFDDSFNDYVYTKIQFALCMMDIDTSDDYSNIVGVNLNLSLPVPNVESFVPYNDVTERVALKWIYDLFPNLPDLQKKNTEMWIYEKTNGTRHPDNQIFFEVL